jgi:hypothetical protein
MDLNTEIKRGEDYVFNEVDGELVMMNIETGSYASMNETGKSIWEALEENKSVESVLNTLTEEYDISLETAQKDVVPFLDQLIEQKIIVLA